MHGYHTEKYKTIAAAILVAMIVLFTTSIHADTPARILPSANQLGEAEAITAACDFLVNHTCMGEYDISTCPYMWLWLSNEDHFYHVTREQPSPHGSWLFEFERVWHGYQPIVYLDSVTGDVLYWSLMDYNDPRMVIAYINAFPEENMIDWTQAYAAALTRVQSLYAEHDLASDNLMCHESVTYGYFQATDGMNIPAWLIYISMPVNSDRTNSITIGAFPYGEERIVYIPA